YCAPDPCDLPSFPTRRSSDLDVIVCSNFLAQMLMPMGRNLDVRNAAEFPVEHPFDGHSVWANVADHGFVQGASLIAATVPCQTTDRKSTRLNSSHDQISYAVF